MGTKTPYEKNPLVPKFLDYLSKNSQVMTRDEFVSVSEYFLKYKN